MGEKKTTPVVIDGNEYVYEDMTGEQQVLISHIADLERKISSAMFNLDQLRVGKDGFTAMLKHSLAKQEEVKNAEV